MVRKRETFLIKDILRTIILLGALIHLAGCTNTALYRAVKVGDINAVRAELSAGADVNAKDNFSRTPLSNAALYGHLEVVRFLVDKGADVNAKHYFGSPLHLAAEYGYLEVVRFLLNEDADPNTTRDNDGKTPMDLAREKGYAAFARIFAVAETYGLSAPVPNKVAGQEPGRFPVQQRAPGASPRTHVVALDGSGDFKTVEDAFLKSSSDDTILLRAGNYKGFNIPFSNVTIMGEGEKTVVE